MYLCDRCVTTVAPTRNGVEKMLRGIGVAEDVDVVDIRYK